MFLLRAGAVGHGVAGEVCLGIPGPSLAPDLPRLPEPVTDSFCDSAVGSGVVMKQLAGPFERRAGRPPAS